METVLHLFTWYPLFGIPAGIGWAAVWVSAGQKRFDLQRGDKELLYLPWLVLYGMSVLVPAGKTLGNLAEVLLVALAVPLALMFRTAQGRVENQARLARRVAIAVCVIAAALWLLLPPLD